MLSKIIERLKDFINRDNVVTAISNSEYETSNDQMGCGYCVDVC